MKSVNESGRSLIELLAVLCIMAVLAMGGIKLYNYAMDYTIAQDTFQEVRKRAITYQERFKEHKYMFEARPVREETVYGYEIYAGQKSDNEKYIQIDVNNVDPNVCRKIIGKKSNMKTVARLLLDDKVYPSAIEECPNTKTKMTFLFYREVANTSSDSGLDIACTNDSNCMGCDVCDVDHGLCVPDNSKCEDGLVCMKLSTNVESACYKAADMDESDDANKCGGGECWVIKEGFCFSNDSLCEESQRCEDGWCIDIEE